MSLADHPHLYRVKQLLDQVAEILDSEKRHAGAAEGWLTDAANAVGTARHAVLNAAEAEDGDQ